MSLQTMLTNCWHDTPSRRPSFTVIQRDFPSVMVDVMCPDPTARKVCRDLWGGQETRKVPYGVFERTFQQHTLIDLSTASLCYRRCLQKMLCDSYDHNVTFERVCNMVHTFGAMESMQDFLHHVVMLFEHPWFFGYLRVCDAMSMLTEQWQCNRTGPGYYLLRFSDSSPGSFSLLTIDTSGEIVRRRIGHQYTSEYYIALGDRQHVFLSLFSLVDFCLSNNAICGGKRPLPGSPFLSLFAANPLRPGTSAAAEDAVV